VAALMSPARRVRAVRKASSSESSTIRTFIFSIAFGKAFSIEISGEYRDEVC
jgi:hypothetical protein